MKNAAHNKYPFSLRVVDLVTSDPDYKFAPYQDMANAIISITHTHGSCASDDLIAVGFTKHEIAERWHMANEMARIELKLGCRARLANGKAAGHAIIKTLNNAIRAVSVKGWWAVQS